MSMSEPAAFLITWTCYGNWLHGDARGSVDREHNIPGTPTLPPDAAQAARERGQLRPAGGILGASARGLVAQTIADHCRLRGWNVLATAVRTNHVHVVIESRGVRPEDMMGQLKAWSARRLREAGLLAPDEPVWTRGGSTRYIWEDKSIAAAVAYVLEGQNVPR
jgi:REP element-mobilizing transposase RayT